MAEIYGKVWGETCPLFKKNNVEIHRIRVDDGASSSWHHHVHKFNMFVVECGTLAIEVEKSYGLVDKTVLNSGQSMVVAPGEVHRFVCLEQDTIAYEIYWVELDGGDIVRRDTGRAVQDKPNTGTYEGGTGGTMSGGGAGGMASGTNPPAPWSDTVVHHN